MEMNMFLGLNAEQVPEIRGVKGELLRGVEEHGAGQKETIRVQAQLTRKAVKVHNVEVTDDE